MRYEIRNIWKDTAAMLRNLNSCPAEAGSRVWSIGYYNDPQNHCDATWEEVARIPDTGRDSYAAAETLARGEETTPSTPAQSETAAPRSYSANGYTETDHDAFNALPGADADLAYHDFLFPDGYPSAPAPSRLTLKERIGGFVYTVYQRQMREKDARDLQTWALFDRLMMREDLDIDPRDYRHR